MPDPKRLALLLDWLVIDYVTLRKDMHYPTQGQGRTAPRSSREYGHPAQWASDKARAIADCLDATNEALRDHLNHLPPPPRLRAESRVVETSYKSLKARTEYLASFPGADAFQEEAKEIHSSVRSSLGLTLQRTTISLPCPQCSCVPVFRTVYDDRRDVIECHECGNEIKEMEYGLYARILIEDLLLAADTSAGFDNHTSQCEHGVSGESLPKAP